MLHVETFSFYFELELTAVVVVPTVTFQRGGTEGAAVGIGALDRAHGSFFTIHTEFFQGKGGPQCADLLGNSTRQVGVVEAQVSQLRESPKLSRDGRGQLVSHDSQKMQV